MGPYSIITQQGKLTEATPATFLYEVRCLFSQRDFCAYVPLGSVMIHSCAWLNQIRIQAMGHSTASLV